MSCMWCAVCKAILFHLLCIQVMQQELRQNAQGMQTLSHNLEGVHYKMKFLRKIKPEKCHFCKEEARKVYSRESQHLCASEIY